MKIEFYSNNIRPSYRWGSDFTDASFLRDRPYLGNVSEGVWEIFLRWLKNWSLRRRSKNLVVVHGYNSKKILWIKVTPLITRSKESFSHVLRGFLRDTQLKTLRGSALIDIHMLRDIDMHVRMCRCDNNTNEIKMGRSWPCTTFYRQSGDDHRDYSWQN